MHHRPNVFLGVIISLSCVASIRAAEGPAALADNFELLDGLEARVWAESPQLFNPTNIDVDFRGRVWVAEGVNYRLKRKPQGAPVREGGDRIVILEDTDGDGAADASKIFVQDPDLAAPLGIAVLGDKIVVTCSPHLIVYTDADGDDVPESKQILLTGFGGRDHDHGVHSVIGHLDGRWYFNVGNNGRHEVADARGWTLRSGRDDEDDSNAGEKPVNRKSDDGRIWAGGIALRVDPDGKNLTPLAHSFRNSYEIALDSFGDMWQTDNDDDGRQACRASWVMEGGSYGYFSADGTRSWPADRRPGQSSITAHWRQEDPGVMPAGEILGAGAPSGVVVYEGGLLPAKYVGCILAADAGRNAIYVLKPIPDGAGFRFEKSTLIQTKFSLATGGAQEPGDRASWFRPSDVAVGTDGAVYIADWYDPMVGGHAIKEKQGIGRILRIAPTGDRTRPPAIDLDSARGRSEALNNPAINVRHAALLAMRKQAGWDAAGLKSSVRSRSGDARMRARAMWALAACDEEGAMLAEQMLDDPDERVRLTAFRILRAVRPDRVADYGARIAEDKSAALRRELAVALRDVSWTRSERLLLKLAAGYDGQDRFYLEAFGVACQAKQQQVYSALLERFGDADPLKWSQRMADFAWRLHPPAAVDALAMRAGSTSLSPRDRQRAVDALAFIETETAATAMAKLVTTNSPEDVRSAAQWWMKSRASNEWKEFAVAQRFMEEFTPLPNAKLLHDQQILLDERESRGDREEAAVRLAKDPQGAMLLIALAAEGTFPKSIKDVVTAEIYRNDDLAVRALASEHFPRRTVAGDSLPPVAELAKMNGDVQRGRAVFFSDAASCAKCHTFQGDGKEIGPDLTAIRTKFARPELLDAILNPSAAIAFGYEPWVIKTKDQQVYAGFIVTDGENVVIKESSGEQRTIRANQIVLRKQQPFSVMPDNVALGLTAQQLADLAEFLSSPPPRAK